jgi:putative acetyltransferase
MSLVVRPERPADFAPIEGVVTDAFGDHGPTVALLVKRIRASDEYEPGLALVAEDEAGVVGHLMVSWVGVACTSRDRILNLSPVAVRSDHQRRGVGTRMILTVLERAEALEEPLVMVEGVPAYYPRFGFERASALGFEPPHDGIPDEAFMVKRLGAYDPAIRGRVVYPAAFDVLGEH